MVDIITKEIDGHEFVLQPPSMLGVAIKDEKVTHLVTGARRGFPQAEWVDDYWEERINPVAQAALTGFGITKESLQTIDIPDIGGLITIPLPHPVTVAEFIQDNIRLRDELKRMDLDRLCTTYPECHIRWRRDEVIDALTERLPERGRKVLADTFKQSDEVSAYARR